MHVWLLWIIFIKRAKAQNFLFENDSIPMCFGFGTQTHEHPTIWQYIIFSVETWRLFFYIFTHILFSFVRISLYLNCVIFVGKTELMMCASKSLSILSVKRKLDDFIRRQKILMQLNRLFGMRFDKQTDEKLKKSYRK